MNEVEKELRFIRAELEMLLSRQGLKPVAVRMEVAAWMVGFKLTKMKQLVKRGDIDSFLVDRVRLIRVAELERWAAAQSTAVGLQYPKVPKTRRKTVGEQIRAIPKR